MGQQALIGTLWSCDRIGCTAQATSPYADEAPQGWLTIYGTYQDSHGGGPGRLDLCSKHATSFLKVYDIHSRDTED